MKTIRSACQLQPRALEVTVGDQIERLDQLFMIPMGRNTLRKRSLQMG